MTPPNLTIIEFINKIKQQCLASKHRGVLLLSGKKAWRDTQRELIANEFPNYLCFTDEPPARQGIVSFQQASHYLGTEQQIVIFNLCGNYTANALGAIAGTITAGGVLILESDPDIGLSDFDAWLFDTLNNHPINRYTEGESYLLVPSRAKAAKYEQNQQSLDQQLAVEAILKVVYGHRNRPLVITADRGRGKTTALGIAGLELLNKGKNILITAPQFTSLQPAFNWILANSQAYLIKQELILNNGRIQFIPPDKLMTCLPSTDLLMIDEAAAIPVPTLDALLVNYSRIVYVSTIHGYEGSGRGFEIRFKKLLAKRKPEWRSIHLKTPIRWAENDPLENFTNSCLLLNSDMPPISSGNQQIAISKLHPAELTKQAELLPQIMALLTISHYRNTPNDLQQLLDNPNNLIYVASNEKQLIGVCLISIEGNLSKDLINAIYNGKKRVKGELIPQSLIYHLGQKSAGEHSFARVVRIAVHPERQNAGIGTQLLKHCKKHLKNKVQAVGSSFGATTELVNFWQKNGFNPVRIAFNKTAASNEFSLLVLDQQYRTQGEQFHQEFLHHLTRVYVSLPCDLVIKLMAQYRGQNLENRHLSQFERVLTGDIHPEEAHLSCKLVILNQIDLLTTLKPKERALLVSYFLQQNPMRNIIDSLSFAGKKEFVSQLTRTLSKLKTTVE